MDGYALRVADADRPPAGEPAHCRRGGQGATAGRYLRAYFHRCAGSREPTRGDAGKLQPGGRAGARCAIGPGREYPPAGQDIAAATVPPWPGAAAAGPGPTLASVGRALVPVYRPLRVAVLSTEDELVEPGGLGRWASGQ